MGIVESMTWEEYEESQTFQKRIVGTRQGKEWVRNFMAYCKIRHEAEYPDDEIYDTNRDYRMTSVYNLFYKYMLEAECDLATGRNSFIMTIAHSSDGCWYQWHNLAASKYQIANVICGVLKGRLKYAKKIRRKEKPTRWNRLKMQIEIEDGLWGWLTANTRLFYSMAWTVGAIRVWRFNRRARKNEKELREV
jgi:hypothetical protein